MPALAYVSNANKVSVIDTSTKTVIKTITIDPANNLTKFIAIAPAGNLAYVTNLYNFVSVIDTCTNTVITNITVGDFPAGIAVTPDGKFVYVANSGLATSASGTVSVIDTATNTVIATIPVGRDPVGVAIAPDGKFVYVTIAKEDSVSVIDTASNTIAKTIPVGDFPQGIAITPNGNFAYVANQGQSALTNTVSVINISTNTVVDTITVGTGPSYIAITPDGNFAYVTNAFDGTVSVIDTAANTVIKTVPVGSAPSGIAVTPDGKFVYVANFISNNVSVIDTTTNTVVNTIPTLSQPLGIAIANIPPCPAPSDKICIETTRIIDSCLFEAQQQKTFKFPALTEDQDFQCEIINAECRILGITQIEVKEAAADVEVFIRVTCKCFNDYGFRRVEFSFNKHVTLAVPEGADVCCEIKNAACECTQLDNASYNSRCFDKVCCMVKVTAVVKSKKLVQIEVPYLRTCETQQPCPYEGIPVVPMESSCEIKPTDCSLL